MGDAMVNFLKKLWQLGGSDGRREAMRRSYEKHLKGAQAGAGPKETTPEHVALYGALGTFYMSRGVQRSEGELWRELVPFLLMGSSRACEALAEYAVFLEGYIDARRSWLQQTIKGAQI